MTAVVRGRHVLSGSKDRTLRMWDLSTGAELASLSFDAVPSHLAWCRSQKTAVVFDGLGRIHLIEPMRG